MKEKTHGRQYLIGFEQTQGEFFYIGLSLGACIFSLENLCKIKLALTPM